MGSESRSAARLRAYRLFEAEQTEARPAALAELAGLAAVASAQDWPDVALLARIGLVLEGVLSPRDPDRTVRDLDELAGDAEAVGPALLAHVLGLRAVMRVEAGDTELALADAARGLALLDRPDLPALDACTALVVCAAAYNTLSLWELVDALYDRAAALEPLCEVPVQAAAIAMNRIVIRLEWASAFLEEGDTEAARQVLVRAAAAAEAAAGVATLPASWRTAVSAAQCALALYLDPPSDPDGLLGQARVALDELRRAGEVEMLPLAETLVALALLRRGRPAPASSWLAAGTVQSVSSGARSFRSWVRAQVLAASHAASAGVTAYQEYAELLARQRRDARRAVLAAARSRIADEHVRAERDRLAIDVALDALTGLANRRAFDAWLERERSEPRLTAVLLVDLDGFKMINDVHGHSAGDEVLRRVGTILSDHVRPGDLAIRVGGDEFALVLEAAPDAAPDEAAFRDMALARGAALADAIAADEWPDQRDDARFGASVGVAVRTLAADDPRAADGLYREADRALYAVKAARRRAVTTRGSWPRSSS